MIRVISIGQFQTDRDNDSETEDGAIQYLTLPEDGGYRFAQQVLLHKGQTAGGAHLKMGEQQEDSLVLKTQI